MTPEEASCLAGAVDDGNMGGVYLVQPNAVPVAVKHVDQDIILLGDGRTYVTNDANFEEFFILMPVSNLME